MSEFSRRDLLVSISLAGMGANLLPAQDAAHVHQAVAAAKATGPYLPKYFNAHEYATLCRLTELIMPADEKSKVALEAGAPEYIDLLASANTELSAIYTGGMAWLDAEMLRRAGKPFVDAEPAQQTALLDLIAFRKNDSPALGPGIYFFRWVRNMTVDAYFSSQEGMDYLGFMGNGAMSSFSVPTEAVEYALKRSGLG